MKTVIRLGFVVLFASSASAQDVEYIRAMERAQQQRPTSMTASSRIAPAGEPGPSLVLHGRVVKADGTPAGGTIVFAYHTDQSGLYDRAEAGGHSWRLRGWAKADAAGRFTFETIRPGPYPDRRMPAHVHFTIFTPSGERYHAGEAKFEDDQFVPPREREASRRAGDFGEVRPVRREGGKEHVEVTLRIDATQRF